MNNLEMVNAGHVTTDPNAGEPIAKAIDTSSAPKAENTEEKKDNSFTYDEGQGVKETVMLTGPLSEIYTRVLAQYFTKKELTTDLDQKDPVKDAAVANESQQLEEESLRVVLDQATSGDIDAIGQKFDFADDTQEPDNVTTKAYLVTPGAALMPEVVENVQTVAQNSNKKIIVVLTAAPKGETLGLNLTNRFVQIDGDSGKNSLYNDEEQFVLAAESLYKPFNVAIVRGIGGLAKHLQGQV